MCMLSTETSINKMISKGYMFKTQCKIILQITEAILRQGRAVGNIQLTFPLRIYQNKKLNTLSFSEL